MTVGPLPDGRFTIRATNAVAGSDPLPDFLYPETRPLVIDTIGLQAKNSYIDNFRTPHTEKLHVVERLKLAADQKTLEALVKVEDPDTFEKPWTAKQRFRRVHTAYTEEVCIEGNLVLHQWELHIADKPDF